MIDEPGEGAFHATDPSEHLDCFDTRSLIFAGVTTEVRVQSALRVANDRSFECLLA